MATVFLTDGNSRIDIDGAGLLPGFVPEVWNQATVRPS